MSEDPLIQWLLTGDVAVQFQVWRDLLGEEKRDLRNRIVAEGWGKRFLNERKPDGHWGRGFYQVKWISSHYTLLDLKHLNIAPTPPAIAETIDIILRENKSADGGINPHGQIKQSDVCINGMILNYACYFKADEAALRSVVDFIISQHMSDGGFNCRSNRQGAVHSSLHTTISVLEGIHEYCTNGYSYHCIELERIAAEAREFILQHRLFLSDRTGKIIDKRFLMLSYPSRWKYDILRALEYFRAANIPYDERMQPALDALLEKRRKDGRWPVQAKHPGKVHFDMEKTGQPSRWNTLRALRVCKHFGLLT
ncbi:MAG: hypothetical protein Kow002_14370 [Anaerolineales bacterium]